MKPRQTSRAVQWGLAALILGLAVSAMAVWQEAVRNRNTAQAALIEATDETVSHIQSATTLYQYGLRGARGAVITAGEHGLTRALFHRYSLSRDPAVEFPGAGGFGFVRRVAQAEEAAFTRAARADGAPEFTVHQLSPRDGERYVIQYIEPATPNSAAVGLDIASEPTRREAAERAMVTGQPAITAPITLVQRPGDGQQAFLLLMPVYRPDMPLDSVAERTAALFGWVYTPLTTRTVMGQIGVNPARLHVALRDESAATPVTFFEMGDTPDGELSPEIRTREIFGRQWQIDIRATPEFVAALGMLQPRSVFLVGAALSVLLAGLVGVIAVSRLQQRISAAERDRLAAIVDNSSDPIVGESLDGRVISWNAAAARKFGYADTEALGRSLVDLLVPPERKQEDAELLAKIAQGGTVEPFETVRVSRDGAHFDLSIAVSPILDSEGRAIGVAKIMRDVGARKAEQRRALEFQAALERQVRERTEALRDTNAMLADVLRAASEMSIIATDVNGTIRIFNRGAERLLGYSATEMIGKQTPAIIHLPEEVVARGKHLTAAYGKPVTGFRVFVHVPELEGSETREWTYVRKDGHRFKVSLVVTAMRDDKGKVTGYLGIAQDITERLHALAALREAKHAAEHANAAKSQFLAMMSHELRTPMTGVLGMADLLLTSELPPEQRTIVTRLARSGRTLLDLLNDILDFARIEAGRIEMEAVDFSLTRLVEDISVVIGPLASERGNSIVISADPGLLPAYKGDAKRFRQVVMNLVGNANKFTSGGTIRIALADEPANGRHRVRATVSDNGIGIPPEVLERLFQPFVQADASTSRKFGGSGLGLAISKGLAEMMGGDVTAVSTPGQGSAFTFTALLDAGDAAVAESSAKANPALALPQPARPLRILVAEDNETSRLLLETMLSRMNHTVTAVENGALAVSAAQSKRFDLILMDMQMPVMDGEEAMRRIKADPARAGVPIIALTADALTENHKRYREAGAVMVVTKPVDWRALSEQMDLAVSRADAGAPPSRAAGDVPGELPVLDAGMINALAAHVDKAGFARLFASFSADMERYQSAMTAAPNDLPELRKAAHALKGVAGQFGAVHLSKLAREVEEAAAKGKIAAEALARIPEAVRVTLEGLQAWMNEKAWPE